MEEVEEGRGACLHVRSGFCAVCLHLWGRSAAVYVVRVWRCGLSSAQVREHPIARFLLLPFGCDPGVYGVGVGI
eukprot:1420303-Rhodomonas_salina.1